MSTTNPGKPARHQRSARPAANAGVSLSSRIDYWKAQWAALSPEDRRFSVARGIGIFILIAIPLFVFLHPENGIQVEWPGGRVVWTFIIALLPLAIVAMGFYTWRRVCP